MKVNQEYNPILNGYNKLKRTERIIQRILIVILIVTIIFISFNKCDEKEKTQELIHNNIKLKEEVKIKEDKAKKYKEEYNKLQPILLNLHLEISDLKKQAIDKQNQYLLLDKKYHENLKTITNFSLSDMQLYFNKRYGTKENNYIPRFDTIKKYNQGP